MTRQPRDANPEGRDASDPQSLSAETMNDSRKPNMDLSPRVSSRALSRSGYQILMIVHGLVGLLWLVILAWFVPKFAELFTRLREKGELPALTEFVMQLSRHSLWFLPLGLAIDAAVLYVLGRLPRSHRWRAVAWFSLVLTAMLIFLLLTIFCLLVPILKMSTTV